MQTRETKSFGRISTAIVRVLLGLMFLVFGGIEMDRMLLVYTTLANATRAGLRYAVVHGVDINAAGVVPADVETGNVEELAAKYPSIAADLRAIAASVRHDRGSA